MSQLYLYRIVIIDPKTQTILKDGHVVAGDNRQDAINKFEMPLAAAAKPDEHIMMIWTTEVPELPKGRKRK